MACMAARRDLRDFKSRVIVEEGVGWSLSDKATQVPEVSRAKVSKAVSAWNWIVRVSIRVISIFCTVANARHSLK